MTKRRASSSQIALRPLRVGVRLEELLEVVLLREDPLEDGRGVHGAEGAAELLGRPVRSPGDLDGLVEAVVEVGAVEDALERMLDELKNNTLINW